MLLEPRLHLHRIRAAMVHLLLMVMALATIIHRNEMGYAMALVW